MHALMRSKHRSLQHGAFEASCRNLSAPSSGICWCHAGMPVTAYTPAPLQAVQASSTSSSDTLLPYSSAAAGIRSAVTKIGRQSAQIDLEVRHCCLVTHVSHFEAGSGIGRVTAAYCSHAAYEGPRCRVGMGCEVMPHTLRTFEGRLLQRQRRNRPELPAAQLSILRHASRPAVEWIAACCALSCLPSGQQAPNRT